MPAVLHKAVVGIAALKPGLFIYGRAVIMRRIDQLVLILAQINGEVLHTTQITAPPVKVIIRIIGGMKILIGLDILGVDLDPFHQHQHVGILFKYGKCSTFCHIFPVICIL